jgi:hypothetical protein
MVLLMELDERQDLRVCSDSELLRRGAAAEATNGCGVGTPSTLALARGRFSMERPIDAAAAEEWTSPLPAKMERLC